MSEGFLITRKSAEKLSNLLKDKDAEELGRGKITSNRSGGGGGSSDFLAKVTSFDSSAVYVDVYALTDVSLTTALETNVQVYWHGLEPADVIVKVGQKFTVKKFSVEGQPPYIAVGGVTL